MIRVGILGGSFDPPHLGHLHISELAIKKLNLLQLWWVPTIQNPLKTKDIKSSYNERISLCKKLTAKNPKIRVKDFEYKFFKNSKNFYTYNLLKRLKYVFPNYEFYLIIGSDSLKDFHKWHKFNLIPKLAKISVFARPNFKKINSYKATKRSIVGKFYFTKMMGISSTQLRAGDYSHLNN